MEDIDRLKRSLLILNESVARFPVAAVTLADYKPISEKIKELRETLNCLTARIKTLKIKLSLHSIENPTEDEAPLLVTNLQNNLINSVINNNAVTACYQSYAVQQALFNRNVDPGTRIRVKLLMANLYSSNDLILKYTNELSESLQDQEVSLQDESYELLFNYLEYLKEKESVRNKKLAESNPEVARKKARALKLITKINMMKRLITNFISVASDLIMGNPELKAILKKHRVLIDFDSIMDSKRLEHIEEPED